MYRPTEFRLADQRHLGRHTPRPPRSGHTVLDSIRLWSGRVVTGTLLALMLSSGSSPALAQQLEDRERSAPAAYAWHLDLSVASVGDIVNQGYRIIDIEVAAAQPLLVNAAFTRNSGEYGKAWWWYAGATDAQIAAALQSNNARLVDIEPTTQETERRGSSRS